MFERICRENGIAAILTKPRTPTTAGKIERWHQTLQRECLDGRVFVTIDEAQAAVDAFVAEYNSIARIRASMTPTRPTGLSPII